MRWLLTSVRRQSVVRLILKTKQDRPVVAMVHYIEVGTNYSIAAFRSSPTRPLCRRYCKSFINH